MESSRDLNNTLELDYAGRREVVRSPVAGTLQAV
jgi:hypothetical protein